MSEHHINDSEVEEALEYFKQNNPSLFVNDETCGRIVHAKHLQTLIKKAQQPRQEWLDISTAPRDGTYFYAWFPAGNSFVHAHAEKCWYNNGDLLIIASRASNHAAPTHWRPDFEQPLPEPPKEK